MGYIVNFFHWSIFSVRNFWLEISVLPLKKRRRFNIEDNDSRNIEERRKWVRDRKKGHRFQRRTHSFWISQSYNQNSKINMALHVPPKAGRVLESWVSMESSGGRYWNGLCGLRLREEKASGRPQKSQTRPGGFPVTLQNSIRTQACQAQNNSSVTWTRCQFSAQFCSRFSNCSI